LSPWKLWWQSATGNYETQGDPADADCVWGLAFGLYKTDIHFVPGFGNHVLASFIKKHFGHLPAFLQDEIWQCIPGLESARPIGRMGTRIKTDEVLDEAWSRTTEAKFEHPLLVCMRYHAPRATAIANHKGYSIIVPSHLPQVWDANSSQAWTRSPARWALKELAVIGYYQQAGLI
jgi:hypothetical protein